MNKMRVLAYKGWPFFFWFLCACAQAKEIHIKRVFLDRDKNAHVVTADGKDFRFTRHGNCDEPEISEDGQTAASICNPADGNNALYLFRNGKIKAVKGDPFVREFRFVEAGKEIAVEIGGLHFAGHQFLYDVSTMKKLADFSESDISSEQRPAWATDKK